MKIAITKRADKAFAVELYKDGEYQETFYCRKKGEIKPHLKKVGYKLTTSKEIMNLLLLSRCIKYMSLYKIESCVLFNEASRLIKKYKDEKVL